MGHTTIREVTVKHRINRRTKLIKARLDTGEIAEFPFDSDEFGDRFTHDDVIESYREEGIEILDWTSENFFE